MTDITVLAASLNTILNTWGEPSRDFSEARSVEDLAAIVTDGTLNPLLESELLLACGTDVQDVVYVSLPQLRDSTGDEYTDEQLRAACAVAGAAIEATVEIDDGLHDDRFEGAEGLDLRWRHAVERALADVGTAHADADAPRGTLQHLLAAKEAAESADAEQADVDYYAALVDEPTEVRMTGTHAARCACGAKEVYWFADAETGACDGIPLCSQCKSSRDWNLEE